MRDPKALPVNASTAENEPNDGPYVGVVSAPDVRSADRSRDVPVDVGCWGEECEVVTPRETGPTGTANSTVTVPRAERSSSTATPVHAGTSPSVASLGRPDVFTGSMGRTFDGEGPVLQREMLQ